MSGLTVERLAELRRIAEAATPGPWAWRMNKDGRILDLITLETGYNEEIITPSHISAWLQFKGGVKDFIPAFDPTTVLELLDALIAARAEAERWKQQYEALWAEMERLQGALNISPDDVLAEIRRRAAIAERSGEGGVSAARCHV